MSGDFYLSIGTVTSAKKQCVPARKVKFIVARPGGKDVVDVARTSDHGGWTSVVPEPDYSDGGVDGTTYKLVPRRVKSGGKKIRCGGEKLSPA